MAAHLHFFNPKITRTGFLLNDDHQTATRFLSGFSVNVESTGLIKIFHGIDFHHSRLYASAASLCRQLSQGGFNLAQN
jgi:hypothetical protein